MSAQTAQEIAAQLAHAINTGDLQSALQMWEKDAKMISGDGSEVRGREAIANVLQTLINNGMKVELELHSLRQAGPTALATGTLTMRTRGPDGESFSHSSDSLVVYHQGEDGIWRVAIDFPWGLPVSSASS
jgi:uncharacterized protein (TIGR02246 family)